MFGVSLLFRGLVEGTVDASFMLGLIVFVTASLAAGGLWLSGVLTPLQVVYRLGYEAGLDDQESRGNVTRLPFG